MDAEHDVSFKDAAKAWLKYATTRSRKQMRDTSVPTIESALANYIYPHIGDLPLSKVHNGTCKPIVDAMKAAKLSSSSMNSYMNIVKSVVKSVVDPETGEPVYNRKWNAAFLDLPVVKHERQPVLTPDQISKILAETCRGSWEHRLFMLLAATGLRIGECLALEWKHVINGGRTLVIEQQVSRFGEIVGVTKTDAGKRMVDLHPAIAAMLEIDRSEGLLFPTSAGTPMLPGNVEKRRLRDFWRGGFHAFRRFREGVLSEADCNHDVKIYWMGHRPETMSELYSKLKRRTEVRLREAERVGFGFALSEGCPQRPRDRMYTLPKVWKRRRDADRKFEGQPVRAKVQL